MSHHDEVNGDIFSPRSKFYLGPYGRMFRNLPPHVPTIDLLKGKIHLIHDLPDEVANCLEDYLNISSDEAKEQSQKRLTDAIDKYLTNEQLIKNAFNTIKNILEKGGHDQETVLKYWAEKAVQDRKLKEDTKQYLKDFSQKRNTEIKKPTLDKLKAELDKATIQDDVIPETVITILSEIKTALEKTDEGRAAVLKLLARTMIEEIDRNQVTDGNNNDYIPAGYTYFTQYITHDITFDPTSSLMRFNDPDKIRNFRTPRLDLDSLYGGGPSVSPFMYRHNPTDPDQKYYLLFDTRSYSPNVNEDDLPRNQQGRALIGDPRNDQTIMISQLHLAFIKFHNATMDWLKKHRDLKGKQAFSEAQRLVRWHYQWVILHDFLPKFVDQEILDDILYLPDCLGQPRLCFYQWHRQPFIPVEFSVAAFRFGHSIVRNKYSLNTFDHNVVSLPLIHNSPERELIGFRCLPGGWTLQWDLFLNFNNHPRLQKSRKIDTQLSYLLSALPVNLRGREQQNLPARDLIRGYKMGLPSGQVIASAMGIPPLDEQDEPLWYYILREAKELRRGNKLGPVGGRIVAEVIIGLLSGDPHSFLNVDPLWQPNDGDPFGLLDILRQAGVPTELKLSEIFGRSPVV